MSIIIITYDLNNPSKDYSSFYSAIQNQGHWWHSIKSTWLVDTNKTPTQVYEDLRHHLLQSDRILIGRLADGYSGWLDKTAWDWIQTRLKQV